MNFQKLAKHWDNAYETKPIEGLGWYEAHPEPSLQLITNAGLDNKTLFIPGAGATILIDQIVQAPIEIYANDISSKALDLLSNRVGKRANLHFIVGDLRDESTFNQLPPVDVWHDRAVFHFLTEPEEIQAYIHQLDENLTSDGVVHIATFHLTGAEKCSGLPVERYDEQKLQKTFAPHFELVDSFEHLYHNPSGGPRPYIYATFRRA